MNLSMMDFPFKAAPYTSSVCGGAFMPNGTVGHTVCLKLPLKLIAKMKQLADKSMSCVAEF